MSGSIRPYLRPISKRTAQRGAGLDPVSIADDQQHVTSFQLHRLVQGCLSSSVRTFKAGRSAFLGQAAECRALSAISLGNLAQFVNACGSACRGRAPALMARMLPSPNTAAKGLNSVPSKMSVTSTPRAKAGIRSSGAKTAHSLVPRHTHERGLHIHAQHFFPQALDQTFSLMVMISSPLMGDISSSTGEPGWRSARRSSSR